MMIQAEIATREILLAFFDQVWSDDTFKARLEINVRTAVEEYFGPIDGDVELEIVRGTSNKKYIHLPASPTKVNLQTATGDLMTAQGEATKNGSAVCPTHQNATGELKY